MLAIRCGVALEDSRLNSQLDWFVLSAEPNPSLSDTAPVNTFNSTAELHIFTSNTAINIFIQLWGTHFKSGFNLTSGQHPMAVGVGSVTDTAVQNLANLETSLQWQFPNMKGDEPRSNGLQWTLERLEQLGLIPGANIHLWTKTNSTSERILNSFRSSRHWSRWQVHTQEIYSLVLTNQTPPKHVAEALESNMPVCFGVKSAEVLEATITHLLKYLGLKTAAQLPSKVRFCAWEKSALQRAQELFLQPRLMPFNEFEKLIAAIELNS
jgi:hypothetical protein